MKKFLITFICILAIALLVYSEKYFNSTLTEEWVKQNISKVEKKYIGLNYLEQLEWKKIQLNPSDNWEKDMQWNETYGLIWPKIKEQGFWRNKFSVILSYRKNENGIEDLYLIYDTGPCKYRFYFENLFLKATSSMCGGYDCEIHLYAVWLLNQGVFHSTKDRPPIYIRKAIRRALTGIYWDYKEYW